MNDTALEQLIERLGGSEGPTATVADIVLAAAEGADNLDAHLTGAPASIPRDLVAAVPAQTPARVYLDQIAVENFRGIGPRPASPSHLGRG